MRTPRDPIYAGHRYPAEIISYAVWLYFRFPLSLRMVEEMLAARGISMTHETIRQWGLKFGRELATICPSHFSVSGIGQCICRRNPSLISWSLALMRSRRDFLLIWKSPRRDLPQMSTKPRNLKVSGLTSPRFLQFCAAKRPNSIRRVLSG